MRNDLLFSSATDEWSTPQAFFDSLRSEFRFALDVAARRENAKCPDYLGPDRDDSRFTDGLTCSWKSALDFTHGETRGWCWMNPPYSRGAQGRFIQKAALERRDGVRTVALLPARTDTKAFHDYIYQVGEWKARQGIEIRLLKGRLKFGGATNSAPFPSMLVIFRPDQL